MTNNKNVINWFDLDNSLWDVKCKWWIISKNNPDKALLKITPEEGSLLVHNYYIKDGLKFDYNGMSGYLSNAILDTINLNRKRKIDISEIGVSIREFQDTSFLDQQADQMSLLLYNIEHLRNTNETVCFLTARGDKDKNMKLLVKLKNALDKMKISVEKTYFVGDYNLSRHTGSSALKKVIIILEHICGFKIENNKFIDEKQEMYDVTHFYDDDDMNIEKAKEINFYLRKFYDASDDEMKFKIETNLKNKSFFVYKITNNKQNLFITTEVKLNLFDN